MQFLPLGLLLGSYAAVSHLWFEKNGRTEGRELVVAPEPRGVNFAPAVMVRFLKISCTACGGHIEFPTNLLGQKIPCPHCRATITLKKPANVKMSCLACDGHIEFPAHAIGEKIPCPHCKTDITLQEPATI